MYSYRENILKRPMLTAFVTIAMASLMTMAPHALAKDNNGIKPPTVPPPIQVPPGNTAFLLGHATGTQGYVCLPSGTTVSWTVLNARPQATLTSGGTEPFIFHYQSPNPMATAPNPFENGNPSPTWQNAQDNSTIWGNKLNSINAGSDPSCPTTGAIPCLLLQVVGSKADPDGDDTGISTTTYVQRLNTTGGSAPATPQSGCSQCCATSTDVGHIVLVPYTADYYFWQATGSENQQ